MHPTPHQQLTQTHPHPTHQTPEQPLLKTLQDIRYNRNTKQGTSGTRGIPYNEDAATLANQITKTLTTIQNTNSIYHPRPPHTEIETHIMNQLDTLQHIITPHHPEHDHYQQQLQTWINAIRELAEKPLTLHLAAKCPTCHTRYTITPDGERQNTIEATITNPHQPEATCKNCETSWQGWEQIAWLSTQIGANNQDAINILDTLGIITKN